MLREESSELDPPLFATQANNIDPNPAGEFDWEDMLEGKGSMWHADGNSRGAEQNESSLERAFVEGPDGRDMNGMMQAFSTTGLGSGFMR